MTAHEIELLAPAKLNLHLGIYPGRDERGYHQADSIMMGVELADVVRVRRADALALTTSDDCGVSQEGNTAFRAARALCAAVGRDESYDIFVEKRIPAQSGLGGASSDAASVLLGLCRLWGVDPLDERVVSVARSLGADVPFFLTMAPALLTGAGDVLYERFPFLPGVPVVLVRPAAGVSTVEAYREFDADPTHPQSPAPMCEALRAGDVDAVAARLYNNLEPAARRLVPETGEARRWLEAQPGVRAAQLTGSGSCVFGLCGSDDHAARVAEAAQAGKKWWSCATKTVGEGYQFC